MTTHKNLLDDLVPEPAGLPELCDASEFTELITGMVADQAPRLFAIVEEYGTRVNARVAGWGLAYEDHVDVIGVDGGIHLGASNPEKILRRFGWRDRIKAHLVWPSTTPDPATE